MTLSLAQILTPVTEAEAFDEAIAILASLGFNATSWQEGSRPYTIVRLVARLQSSATQTIAQIAEGGFNQFAKGAWLDLLSESHYANTRVAAVNTEGAFLLTASATAPPATITDGQLQFATTATLEASTRTYRSVGPGSLSPGGTLEIPVVAEVAGEGGNIPNSQPLFLWTPLVGVTATNPPDVTTGTWITTPGVDEESDDRLRQRNETKWATLSYAATDGAYANWALEASTAVTRVFVDAENPGGAGTVDVYVASATGGIASGILDDISDYIHGVTDGVGRRPLNDVVTVRTATVASLTVSGVVYVESSSVDVTTLAAVQAAIDAFLGALPIGGTVVPPATDGAVLFSQLLDAIHSLAGVVSVELTAPTANTVLTATQIVTGSYGGLSVVYV